MEIVTHLQRDLQLIKNVINSEVQYGVLNILSVYFNFNTLSCQKYFFQMVWRVY